jgi:phosphoglycolate phosphatase
MGPVKKLFPSVRVLIFDLDGTLIDSKLDLALAVNATLEHLGRATLDHDTIFSFVGNGATVLIRRALGEEVTDAQADAALGYFLSYYRAHMLDHTVAYPGVHEALERLALRPMAVLTNKPVNFSRAILDGLDLSRYFRVVYGGNSFERKKPDPIGVKSILRDLGATPAESMMIGDSDVDIMTARNAGIFSAGVSYGIGSDSLRSNPPDIMLDSLVELPGLLDRPAL